METIVNVVVVFGLIIVIMAVANAIEKPGNKAHNFKSEMKDACSGLSNSLMKTTDSLNRKLNNWTDSKIDEYTAIKRLKRTRTRYKVKYDGNTTFITAFEVGDFIRDGDFITVEYKDGKYVRSFFLDDSETTDLQYLRYHKTR